MQHRFARTYRVAPIYLIAVFEAAVRLGHDPGDFCADLGFDIVDLHEPDFTVTHHDACVVIRRALRVLKIPHIGFDLGQRANLGARGALALGMLSSRTLKEAMTLMLDRPAHAGFLLALDAKVMGDQYILIAESWPGSRDLLPFLTEMTFVGLVRLWRVIAQTTSYSPIAVHFSHSEPEIRRRAYEQFFGCPVHFDAPEYKLIAQVVWLDVELPFRSLASFRLAQKLLEHSDLGESAARGIETRVMAELQRVYRHRSPFARVAAQMGLSERTLRRRLSDAGLDFQALLDECRACHAMDLIKQSEIALKEVAHLTGFSSVSSLRRAFKRWTGRTLSEHNQIARFVRDQGEDDSVR